MKTCQNCGHELLENGAFCGNCGTPVEVEAPAQVPVVIEQPADREPSLSPKATAILAYFGWMGIILAVLLGDKKGAVFHLNQSIVIHVAACVIMAVSIIPILGWIASGVGLVFIIVCWCMGLYYACKSQEKEVPVLGKYRLYK